MKPTSETIKTILSKTNYKLSQTEKAKEKTNRAK